MHGVSPPLDLEGLDLTPDPIKPFFSYFIEQFMEKTDLTLEQQELLHRFNSFAEEYFAERPPYGYSFVDDGMLFSVTPELRLLLRYQLSQNMSAMEAAAAHLDQLPIMPETTGPKVMVGDNQAIDIFTIPPQKRRAPK